MEYLSSDVVTQINFINQIPSEFPGVTFFNLRNSKAEVNLNDFMISCTFDKQICTEKDFSMTIDRHGYISYSFKKRSTYLSGSSYGLRLLVYLEKVKHGNDSNRFLDGLKLIVHDYLEDPEYYNGNSNEGIILGPGYTSLSVRKQLSFKLDKPYNDCIKNTSSLSSSDSMFYKHIVKSTKFRYRQKDCLQFCIGHEMLMHYNMSNQFKIADDHLGNVWKILAKLNVTESDIMKTYLYYAEKKMNESCILKCPEECDTIQFDITASWAKFSKMPTIQDVEFENISNIDLDSLIGFNVYLNDLKYTQISEIPAVSIFEFVSNIGGILGVFLGELNIMETYFYLNMNRFNKIIKIDF